MKRIRMRTSDKAVEMGETLLFGFGALRRKLTSQSKINCRNNKIKPLRLTPCIFDPEG